MATYSNILAWKNPTDRWLLFSHSVVSNSLWPYGLQHARLPCPSPSPRACSNSCPLRQWCHPTISSSVIPFSSCLQSSPASGSFQMSQLFASGGQSIGVWASTSVFPMNIQDWFPLGWTGWISLQSKGLSRVFSNTTAQKHQKPGELASRKGSQRVRQDWATKHKRTALSTRSQQVTSSLEHRSLHEESTWLHKRFQLGSGSVCPLLLYAFMALVHRNPSRVKGSNPFILLAFCFFFLLHVMKNCL